MPFTIDTYQIADVKIESIELRAMLGAYELVFVLIAAIDVPAPNTSPRWYSVHSASVIAQAAGRHGQLGAALPRAPILIIQRERPYTTRFELKLMLHAPQLSALEELRGGHDLQFQLTIAGTGGKARAGRNEALDHATVHSRIEQSAWIKQLESARAYNVLLIEVRLPFSLSGQNAIEKCLRRANGHFDEGRYRECIADCRQKIEEMSGPGTSDPLQLLCNDRRQMTKDQREEAILGIIKHYTNLAAHSEAKGGVADYSRSDAGLVLSLTTAFVSHRSNRP